MTNKQLKYTLQKYRASAPKAPKPARFPSAPKHFADEERQLWRKIVRDFDISDAAALALLQTGLEAHARQRRCRESIDKFGEILKNPKGGPRAHPLLSAERDSRAAWLAAMRALGVLETER